jgi:cytochrome c biogenesis protein CcdA
MFWEILGAIFSALVVAMGFLILVFTEHGWVEIVSGIVIIAFGIFVFVTGVKK